MVTFLRLARLLRRHLAQVLLVALGVGASACVIAAAWAVLYKPLPYADDGRVAAVFWDTGQPGANRWPGAYLDVLDLQEALRESATFAYSRIAPMTWRGSDLPERVDGARVSTNLAEVLGLALTGPGFDTAAAPDPTAVVVSERLARRLAGSREAALGRSLMLDGSARRIVGVWPDGADYPTPETDVWMPFVPNEVERNRALHMVRVLARLAPGQTPATLERAINPLLVDLARRYPTTNSGFSAHVLSFRDAQVGGMRATFALLAAVAATLVVIAAANALSIALAALVRRRGELALRAALGASTRRLAWLLAGEHAVCGVASAVLGLALGAAFYAVAIRHAPPTVRLDPADLWQAPVLVASLALAVLTSVLSGAGAWLLRDRGDLASRLGDAGRSGALSRRTSRALTLVVGTQVALALALLVDSTLLGQSLLRALAVDPGFRATGLGTLTVGAPPGQPAAEYYLRLLEHLRATPGVATAELAHRVPLHPLPVQTNYADEGKPNDGSVRLPAAEMRIVSNGLLAQLGIRLVAGRSFADTDRADAPPVAIVSRTLAEREWPGEDALGKRMRLADGRVFEVIGLTHDLRVNVLEGPPEAVVLLPLAQSGSLKPQLSNVVLVLRTRDPFGAFLPRLREALRTHDGDLAGTQPDTLEAVVARASGRRTFTAALVALFGAITVALALAGVYGVLSYRVAQRGPEFAVRMSFGATRAHVLREVLQGALRVLAGSLVPGLALALATAQLLAGQLFEVGATDWRAYAGAAALIALAMLVAALAPAARAARTPPVRVLRDG